MRAHRAVEPTAAQLPLHSSSRSSRTRTTRTNAQSGVDVCAPGYWGRKRSATDHLCCPCWDISQATALSQDGYGLFRNLVGQIITITLSNTMNTMFRTHYGFLNASGTLAGSGMGEGGGGGGGGRRGGLRGGRGCGVVGALGKFAWRRRFYQRRRPSAAPAAWPTVHLVARLVASRRERRRPLERRARARPKHRVRMRWVPRRRWLK